MLRKIGIMIFTIGLLVLCINFLEMYKIPGKCPELDNINCSEYKQWQMVDNLSKGTVAAGVVIICVSFIKRK